MRTSLIPQSSAPFDPENRNHRGFLARIVLLCVFGVLLGTFFRLQVIKHASHVALSTRNQVKTIPLPAPRGFIYDRDGELIAENVPAYSVSLLPESEEQLRASLRRVRTVLDLDPSEIEPILRQYSLAPGQPILLDDDLDYRVLSLLEEKRSEIPGLLLQPRPRRVYAYGEATAHLTGYVAQIAEAELSERRELGYDPGDIVGKSGLEKTYESELQGRKGAEYLEVDVRGRWVGPWPVKPFDAPKRGADLHVSVDLDLQRRAAELFPEGRRGAVVGLDPNTGEILLLYSSPSFDPSVFSGRLTPEAWNHLANDPSKPLLNRAIQARYAPGSVFKLATAAMAMMLGVVDPEALEDVPCKGGYQFGRRWFGCHAVHGWAAMTDAIITSCDTYFYQVGLSLGLEEITRLGIRWGFAGKTGVDMPNETASIYPESIEWYDDLYGEGGWGPGVVLNLSIGQGEIAMTPLKQAQLVAAIVNGGRMLTPRVRKTDEPPEVVATLPLASDQFEVLKASLTGVVNDWRGTAFHRANATGLRYMIGGKSGTVEHNGGPPHGWFVAVGPMERPEIVVAVVVEEGRSGSAQSPIAFELVQTYLDSRNGLTPIDTEGPPPIALGESAANGE